MNPGYRVRGLPDVPTSGQAKRWGRNIPTGETQRPDQWSENGGNSS